MNGKEDTKTSNVTLITDDSPMSIDASTLPQSIPEFISTIASIVNHSPSDQETVAETKADGSSTTENPNNSPLEELDSTASAMDGTTIETVPAD